MSDDSVVEWLLAGDPVIRWQVMRDLLDQPAEIWEAERRRTLETGWVAEMLRRQGRDGEWPKGRWTASRVGFQRAILLRGRRSSA